MGKYFHGPQKSIDAELARHKKEEVRLRKLIEESDPRRGKVFSHFLYKLLESKADIVDQIGRVKRK